MRVLEAPEAATSNDAGTNSRRRLLNAASLFVVVVVAVAVLAAGVVAVIAITRPDEPDHPEAWDPRVVGLVDFVEAERDLDFHHPVTVEFLPVDQFEAEMRAGFAGDVSEEGRRTLASGAAMFRALGLAEGDLDLLANVEQFSANGTLGKYLFDGERIVIRGDVLDVQTSAVVVHELTHTLQDQIFDVGDRLEAESDGDESTYLHSIIEGDAEMVEDAWIEQLDPADRDELDRLEQAAVGDEDGNPYAGIPQSLVAYALADYTVGQDFVEVLDGTGRHAVDEALAHPPRNEEQLLDPWTYLHDDDAEPVGAPGLTEGETRVEGFDGEFGALGLYLVLAERIDPIVALEAVNGWGGDDFVTFDHDGRTCVRVRVRGEDPVRTNALETVLQDWSRMMPVEAGSKVERVADTVNVESCDPGPAADVIAGEGRSLDAVGLLQTRSAVLLSAMRDGTPLDVAHCLLWAALPAVGFSDVIADEWSTAANDAFTAAIADAVPRCRG